MSDSTFRSTAIGAAVGLFLFVGLGVYLNSAIGAGPLDHPGPQAILALIGGTVGALVGPLVASRSGNGEEH